MTQNRKQLLGYSFFSIFFKSMFISFFLVGCGTRPNDLQVEHTESGNWEEEYMFLCFLFLTFKYGVLSFIFKEFHNLWLAKPPGQGSCREKISAVQRKSVLGSTKHSSVSIGPLQWWQQHFRAQALALWIWEIAVGTIKRIKWTQSDLLSKQTSSGRSRSEELASLLAALRSELHSSQNGG